MLFLIKTLTTCSIDRSSHCCLATVDAAQRVIMAEAKALIDVEALDYAC